MGTHKIFTSPLSTTKALCILLLSWEFCIGFWLDVGKKRAQKSIRYYTMHFRLETFLGSFLIILFLFLFFFSLESIRKKSGSNLMATHLCHTFCPKLRWRRCSAIVNKVEMYSSRLSLSHAIFFGIHKIHSKVGNVDPTYSTFHLKRFSQSAKVANATWNTNSEPITVRLYQHYFFAIKFSPLFTFDSFSDTE